MRVFAIFGCCVFFTGCTLGIAECDTSQPCKTAGALCVEGFCTLADASTGGGSGGGGGSTTGGGGGSTGGGTTTGGGGGEIDAGVACSLRTTACPAGFECRETVPGEANCVVAYESLSLTVGDGGALFNTRAPGVSLVLVRKSGFTTAEAPGSVAVAVTLPDGVSTGTNVAAGAADTFSGALSLAEDGNHSAVGSATFTNEDGGVEKLTSPQLSFTVDTLRPQLSWQMLAPEYKRDDIVVLKVDALESLGDATAFLNGVQLTRLSSCPDAGACFEADFSIPELRAISANWPLEVLARDLAGNAADAGTTVAVTRVRWTQQLSGDIRAAPAVGTDGTIYVGTAEGANQTSGLLSRLNPETGQSIGDANFGGIVSIAVSPQATTLSGGAANSAVFVLGNSASSRGELRGLAADLSTDAGLGQQLPPAAVANNNIKAWSGVALTKTTGQQVSALATTASAFMVAGTAGAGRILKWDSVDGAVGPNPLAQKDAGGTLGSGGSPLEPVVVGGSNGASTAVPVVVQSGVATFVTRQPSGFYGMPSEGLILRRVSNLVGLPALDTTATILVANESALTNGQVPVAGGTLVATQTSTKNVHYFASVVSTGTPGGNVDYGVPSIAAVDRAFLGAGTKLIRINPTDPVTLGTQLHDLGSSGVRTMPVLAAAAMGRPETGYAVAMNGRIIAFDSSASAQSSTPLRWEGSVPGINSSVETHMAFDCNRRTGAARSTTGIIYIAYFDGHVAAVLVDSPRLEDGPAAWPKYQRSMGNAGNDDTAFFPTNWACP